MNKMKQHHRTFTAGLLIGAFALGGTMIAHAQGVNYPNKPIRMILGFPPGGPTDLVARIIGQKMTDQLGQSVVIDNKPGAAGNIAADIIAKAAPDGYTVFYNTSSITISPWVYTKVNFDPVKDFTPVALTAEMPLVLLVNPNVQAKTAPELVQYIKANPGKFNYGSSGVGAIEHLTSAQFVSTYGLKVSHIPYKGTAPALIDLIAGRTEFMLTTLNTAIPFVKDGRLRALGVTSVERSRVLPGVPTIAEAMMNGDFASTAWQGIVAPAGTPREIIEKLNRVVNAVVKDPAVVQQLTDQGVTTLGGTSEQYGSFIQKEFVRWQHVVKESGAKVE
jgi:tripartite-type tricarboxylate transporter receptor subunit TctC